MSTETAALVRALFDSYRAGDMAQFERAFAPEVVWLGAEPGTACNGRTEVVEFLGRQKKHGLQLVLEEVLDAGDKVLAVIRVPGIAALQGRERDERGYHVMTVQGTTVVAIKDFTDRESALAELKD